MNFTEITAVVRRCHFPGYTFEVCDDGDLFLRAFYEEPDVHSGAPSRQFTRIWFLTETMTPSEIVQTVLKCVLTSTEHRTREHFHYRGRAVFGPHLDVEALWALLEP